MLQVDSEELKIEIVNNKEVVIVNGAKVQVWRLEEKRWGVTKEIEYKGLKVVQTVANVRLRLKEA